MSWAWTSPTSARESRIRILALRGRPITQATGWNLDPVALELTFTCASWAVKPSPGPRASRSSRMTSRRNTNGCGAPASSSRFRPRRWNGASGSASSRIRTGTCSTSSSRSPPRNGRPRSLPRSPARVVGSDRLRSPTRFQAQRTIGARGGFVESPELREDEAHVHPRAPVTRIDIEGALVASERLVELPEARERVSLVQPGDLIVRVDVKRPVDGAKRLIVPAEEDERRPLAVPRHLRSRDARARRGDREIVVRERLFVIFASHIPLRSDELPPKGRRRVPAQDFRGRQGRRPRHRRTDTRDPWEAHRVRGIGDRRDGLANDGNRARDGQ